MAGSVIYDEFCGKRCKYGSPFKRKKEDKPTIDRSKTSLGYFLDPNEEPKDSDRIEWISDEYRCRHPINTNPKKVFSLWGACRNTR